jgi:hypothetical protein
MADEERRPEDAGEHVGHAGAPAASGGGPSEGTVGARGSGTTNGEAGGGVTGGGGTAGDGDKAGTPAELLSGLVGAATKWTQETGDPDIAKAFLLGWRIGVALDWAKTGTHTMWPDDDPGLDAAGRWAVLKGQVESAAKELTSGAGDTIPLGAFGDAPPEPNSKVVASTARR